jgi:hypothetical protein
LGPRCEPSVVTAYEHRSCACACIEPALLARLAPDLSPAGPVTVTPGRALWRMRSNTVACSAYSIHVGRRRRVCPRDGLGRAIGTGGERWARPATRPGPRARCRSHGSASARSSVLSSRGDRRAGREEAVAGLRPCVKGRFAAFLVSFCGLWLLCPPQRGHRRKERKRKNPPVLAPTSEGGYRVALLSFILVCSAGLFESYSNYPTERSTDFLRGICLQGSGCRKRVLGFNAGTPVDVASTLVVTAPHTPPGSGSVDGVVSGDAAEAHCSSLSQSSRHIIESHVLANCAFEGALLVRGCGLASVRVSEDVTKNQGSGLRRQPA